MSDFANWAIPLKVSITLGTPTLVSRPAPTVLTTPARTIEGLFRRTPAESAGQFDSTSLTATRFEWRTSLSLALASKLSYEPAATVRSTAMNAWGLHSCTFIEADDTQCFVAASAGAVVVAFRGTESLGDWLANLNLVSTTRSYGAVHRGFLAAFQVVESELRATLANLGGRPVLLTGHSLVALATIAAAELQGQLPVSWIYTYGQPAVGKGSFPAFFNRYYAGTFIRFVNDDDVVPRVPPTYRHIGRLVHFDARGQLQNRLETTARELASELIPEISGSTEEPRMLSETEFEVLRAELLSRRAQARAAGLESLEVPILEGLLPSVSDHSIDEYIAKIASNT